MPPINRTILVLALALCTSCAQKNSAPVVETPRPLPTPPRPASGSYSIHRIMPIGGDGRWDYVTIDPRTRILYVPRQTHTQMILATTGEVIHDIPDTNGVHGVALVPELHRGFTSNGKADSVTVFDSDTGRVLGSIAAGGKPDAIIYDPASRKVLAFNGDTHDVTVIDPAADPKTGITKRIMLDGAPEFAASDGQGRVYVNLEDRNSVQVIDTGAMAVTDEWPIRGGQAPSGIAVDPARHHLYCGCRNQVLAVVDTLTGTTLATLPIGTHVDACACDPVTGLAYASCGDGTLTVVRGNSRDEFEVVQVVKTRLGARTMALDPTNRWIYLPTAEYAIAPAGGRPAPVEGTFKLVVVSPSH